MTKCIILGDNIIKDKKPIEFKYFLQSGTQVTLITKNNPYPKEYTYIDLISKQYDGEYDLMFAYNSPYTRSNGILYIGYWNDGVVQHST